MVCLAGVQMTSASLQQPDGNKGQARGLKLLLCQSMTECCKDIARGLARLAQKQHHNSRSCTPCLAAGQDVKAAGRRDREAVKHCSDGHGAI